MALGNGIGAELNADLSLADLFSPAYGSLILELTEDADIGTPLGRTTAESVLVHGGQRVTLEELQAPYQAPAAQGRSLVLFDLLLGVLPYAIVGLSDEPGGGTWERKRIEGFWDTVRAWRGRAYVDSSATVVICPAWDDANPGPHVWALTDGDGGNLSSFEPAETHQPYNAFVMTATAENQDAVTETWYLPDTELAWGGRYGFRPGFISGAHLPRDPWALRYLAEVETRRQLRFWDTYTFETPFDPRPEVGDVVKVSSTRQGVSGLARITALTLTRSTLAGKVTML